ncbi:MAG: hypothetical protein ABI400_01025 [Lacisediminihabitans sp.]
MDNPLTTTSTIDPILSEFFGSQLDGKKGVTRRRIEDVEACLRACIEMEAERILVSSDLLLLASEREFDPVGAVARVMHAEDLIFILSIFVGPQWQPTDPRQRQIHLRITELLTRYLLRLRLVDGEGLCCPLLDIECGISRGRDELRRLRHAIKVASGA